MTAHFYLSVFRDYGVRFALAQTDDNTVYLAFVTVAFVFYFRFGDELRIKFAEKRVITSLAVLPSNW